VSTTGCLSAEGDAVAEPEDLCDPVPVTDRDTLWLPDALALPLDVELRVGMPDGVAVELWLCVSLTDGVCDGESLALNDGVPEGVTERVAACEGEADELEDEVALGDQASVAVSVVLGERVSVGRTSLRSAAGRGRCH